MTRAPVQGVGNWHFPRTHSAAKPTDKEPGTIAWVEHVEAWCRYAAQYGDLQSAERIAERGGFSWNELVSLLGREPGTWQPLPKR